MQLNSVALGILAWTLGISVPALYAAVMTYTAVSHDTSHVYPPADLMSMFNSMPLLMWIYTILMALLGLLLVLRGLHRPSLQEELSV